MSDPSEDEPGEPLKTEAITDGFVIEKYEDCIRLVQRKPGEFVPDNIVIPNGQVESVAGTMEELESTVVIQKGDG